MEEYEYRGIGYRLHISLSRIVVFREGRRIAGLLPAAEVRTVEERDGGFAEHPDADGPATLERLEDSAFLWRARSAAWEKEYRLDCDPEGFEFTVTVRGRGSIGQVSYFARGREDGKTAGSDYHFCEYFIPCAGTDANFRNVMPASLSYRSFVELLIPPPFCFSFRTEGLDTRFALGLAAREGEYNFLHYDYTCVQNESHRFGFFVSTDLEGHTKVNGSYELPKIRAFFAESDLDAVRKYAEYHYSRGLCRRRDFSGAPRWWKGPIVCGWNEQERFAVNGKTQKSAATQQVYTEIAELIRRRGIHPTILIIDDKWQRAYGDCLPDPEKWPDMRGFVDEMHRRDIHVLLWFRLWGGEGLPEDEVMPGEGIPYRTVRLDYAPYADPTNPKYRERLKHILHTLLSDEKGCMNCDGFKLDYSLVMPYGKTAKSYGGQYGFEMTKRLYELIYDTAKAVKPDALINASPCHPYFAEVCDEARLHDYGWGLRNETEQMTFRAKLFDAAMPGVLIDTDSVNYGDREDAMRYFRSAGQIGIPDLYRFYSDEDFCLSEADWEEIRRLFDAYGARIDGEYD